MFRVRSICCLLSQRSPRWKVVPWSNAKWEDRKGCAGLWDAFIPPCSRRLRGTSPLPFPCFRLHCDQPTNTEFPPTAPAWKLSCIPTIEHMVERKDWGERWLQALRTCSVDFRLSGPALSLVSVLKKTVSTDSVRERSASGCLFPDLKWSSCLRSVGHQPTQKTVGVKYARCIIWSSQ